MTADSRMREVLAKALNERSLSSLASRIYSAGPSLPGCDATIEAALEAMRRIRNEALEEAAKTIDAYGESGDRSEYGSGVDEGLRMAARSIRGIITHPHTKE